MSGIDEAKAYCVNFYNRTVQFAPESAKAGILGAGLTLASIALRVNFFAFNPLAAGIFCAATHFIKKTIVDPICKKFVNTSNVNVDFKTFAPYVLAMSIASIAITRIAPSMGMEFGNGAVIYVASLLSLSVL